MVPFSILLISMLPSHKSCLPLEFNTLDGASQQLHQLALSWCVTPWKERDGTWTRGSPGTSRGNICVTPLMPERSGGRGQHHAVSAVAASICLLGYNLPYSKVDACSRAGDSCPQSSCFSPLTSAFSQVSPPTAHPLLQADEICLLSPQAHTKPQSPKKEETEYALV